MEGYFWIRIEFRSYNSYNELISYDPVEVIAYGSEEMGWELMGSEAGLSPHDVVTVICPVPHWTDILGEENER